MRNRSSVPVEFEYSSISSPKCWIRVSRQFACGGCFGYFSSRPVLSPLRPPPACDWTAIAAVARQVVETAGHGDEEGAESSCAVERLELEAAAAGSQAKEKAAVVMDRVGEAGKKAVEKASDGLKKLEGEEPSGDTEASE